jgi:hypothetical protein
MQRGQVLVETVLVVPMLVIFILCIVQVGMLFIVSYTANYASFCAVRSAVVHTRLPDNPAVYARLSAVYAFSSLGINKGAAAGALTVRCGICYPDYEVTVMYPCRVIVPVLSGFIKYIPVTSSCRLPIEK